MSSSIYPDSGLHQLGEVRSEIEVDAVPGPVQGHAAEEEDGEEEVGEEGGEVDHLASPLHSLPDAEVAEDPSDAQSCHQLQSEAARLVDLNKKSETGGTISPPYNSPRMTSEEFSSPKTPRQDP